MNKAAPAESVATLIIFSVRGFDQEAFVASVSMRFEYKFGKTATSLEYRKEDDYCRAAHRGGKAFQPCQHPCLGLQDRPFGDLQQTCTENLMIGNLAVDGDRASRNDFKQG